MSEEHLSSQELDGLLLEEPPGEEVAAHFAACLVCRRRLEALRRAISPSALLDPPQGRREGVRKAVLAAWGAPRQARRGAWWWAAAAALVVALSLPLWRGTAPAPREVDAAEVLAQVDELLAGDPVSAAFSPELVNALAGEAEAAAAGSSS